MRASPDRACIRLRCGSLVLVVAAWSAPLAAQPVQPVHRPIRFDRAEIEPFLPQSSIYAVHQDRSGFLWFATREGLARWDGYEMRTWKATPFEPHALPGNLVRWMVEDRNGDMWAAVQQMDRLPTSVVRLLAPDYERVERYPYPDAIPFLDRDGGAWLVDGDSVRRFDPARGFVGVAGRVSTDLAVSAFVDRGGSIWVGLDSGRIEWHGHGGQAGMVEDPAPRRRSASLAGPSQGFFEDDRNQLWVLGVGIRKLDPDRRRVLEPSGIPPSLDTVGTGPMLQDTEGWLWVGTLDGVYRFTPTLAGLEHFPLSTVGDVDSGNWVTSLHIDRGGIVWAGTPWGLHRYDPWAPAFERLEHDPDDPNTISPGFVMALEEDDQGALWIGTLGGGTSRVDRRTGAVLRLRQDLGGFEGLERDWIWSIVSAGAGRVWVGAADGLYFIDPAGSPEVRSVDLGPVLPSWPASATALLLEPDGGLWFGHAGGLVRRAHDGTLERHAFPIPAEVHQLLRLGDHLWMATSDGLFRMDTRSGSITSHRHDPDDPRSLGHDVVLSLHADTADRLWVGTASGLDRLDPDSGFVHVRDVVSLPSAVVYSIVEDGDGRLWLATNRGLVRFDPSAPEGTRVRVYDPTAGVGNVEFNRNAATRGRDGTVFFGGDRGVTYFDPASIRDNPHRPPVVITAVHRSTRDGSRTDFGVGTGPIVLAPDEYTVTFELAALAFARRERSRYEVQLEGFDPGWVPTGTNRSVSYTNLPPGRYVFRARATNADGLWNMEGLAVPVIVEPWFWETRWFWALAFLASVAGVATITSSIQRFRHRRQLEAVRYERALESERARISRDMHDEVGAGLTEIAILTETASLGDGHGGAVPRELERIAERSRSMLDAIGEIVWALNPDHDRPERLTAYLRQFAADYLESAGVRTELAFDASSEAAPVTSEFRRYVLLVLKEALANVAKHSGAGIVHVRCVLSPTRLVLEVVDDGRGFEHPTTSDGRNGLRNMDLRARTLGGRLEIESAPGRGTRLVLDVPVPGPEPVPSR